MKGSKTSTNRRQYDDAFKAKILEMHNQGRSVSSLAVSFGINTNVIYRWRKMEAEGPSEGINKEYIDELKQLRRQLREVALERDILKKALGIFSRQH